MVTVTQYMSVGVESLFGSSATADYYVDIESETIRENNDVYLNENISQDSPVDHYIQKRWVEGDFTFVPRPRDLGPLLACLLPEISVSGSTHTYHNGTSTAPLSCTIGMMRNTSGEALYVGNKFNATLNANAGNPLMLTFNVMGARQEEVGSTGDTPTFSTDEIFRMCGATLKLDTGTTLDIKALEIRIDSGYDMDGDVVVGSCNPQEYTKQMLIVEGRFTARDPIAAQYSLYRSGSSGSFNAEFLTTDSGGSTAPFQINIPNLAYTEANEGPLNKRDRNNAEFTFRGLWDAGSAYTIRLDLLTDTGSEYT